MTQVINYLFITLPEYYIAALWGAVIFGQRFSNIKYKLIGIAAISALISDLTWVFNYFADFRIFLNFLFLFILYKYILKVQWKISAVMTLIALGSLLISEIIIVTNIIKYINVNDIINNIWLKALVIYTYISPILLLSLLFHLKRWSLLKLFKTKQSSKKVTYYWLSILFLTFLQIYILIYLNYGFYMNSKFLYQKLFFNIHGLPIFSIILVLINFLLIMVIIKLKNYYTKIEISQTESDYNQHMESLLVKLKMERHDFINELQAIHGMVQAGLFDHLQDYMSEIVQQVKSTNRVIQLKNTPVSALLQTKVGQIESEGVKLNIITETDDQFASIKGYDLVKIISNLLDNSHRAVIEGSATDPYIELFWGKQESTVAHIRVSNNGPKIDKKGIDMIFQKGYTTKKEKENSGYGLSIVKSIVDKYKGIIEVESSEEITSFIIKLPL